MAMTSERHDFIADNVAKVVTAAVIAVGLALAIAVFIYAV